MSKKVVQTVKSWNNVPAVFGVYYTAMLLNIKPQNIRKMAREGSIPATKVGGKFWRFEKTTIMKFLGVTDQS